MSLPTLYEHYTGDGITHGLSANQSYFTLNNKNITIYSGAMHYFRVPQEYWRDRLKKMRAAGLNAVETYVPWNLHEPQPGVYDFGEGGTDFQDLLHVEKFLKTAHEEDLLAIVRPGPYICSEWEFGGMPSWLLSKDDVKIRTSDAIFMGYVEKYFKTLLSILTLLQFTKGGPVIAFQIENEYGTLRRNDSDYLEGLKNILNNNGVVELLFTSDGASIGNYGQIPGVLYTANFKSNSKNQLDIMQTYQPGKPSMVMEYWSGWFDRWTENHHKVTNLSSFSNELKRILEYPASVNFYMFHGGTSFGFMNGASIKDSSTDNKGFQPQTNSYDYDAPLNENGDYTNKYDSLAALIKLYNKIKTALPEKPALIKRTAYRPINIQSQITLKELIKQIPNSFTSKKLIPMEKFPINNNAGQSYGYAVYRKSHLDLQRSSKLKIKGRVCDTVMVVLNGKLQSKVLKKADDFNNFGYWRKKNSEFVFNNYVYNNAQLDLVVENWGRGNFGKLTQFIQHKGLWQGNVTIKGKNVYNWEIFPLEFKKSWINGLTGWKKPTFEVGPTLYKAVLHIEGAPEDTYIDMRNWNKGIIIVNGFVLSRHLRLGPQQAAYLPAPFLKTGNNEILVFEHFTGAKQIKFSDKQIFKIF